MAPIDCSLFPSVGELQEKMRKIVDDALDPLPHPLTEAAVDAALKGKVSSWNWHLTWGSNEADVEEAEAQVKAGEPVDVLIFGFDSGGNKNFAGYRARMIVREVA